MTKFLLKNEPQLISPKKNQYELVSLINGKGAHFPAPDQRLDLDALDRQVEVLVVPKARQSRGLPALPPARLEA